MSSLPPALEIKPLTPKEKLNLLAQWYASMEAKSGAAESKEADGPIFTDPASQKYFQFQNLNGKPVLLIAENDDASRQDGIISIGIEMYFHISRYVRGLSNDLSSLMANALIQRIAQNVLDRLHADEGLRLALESGNTEIINHYVDENRERYLTQIVLPHVIQTLKNSEIELREDWKPYLISHTAGAITVIKANANQSISVVEMCDQSSHSKKHADPAIVPMRHYAPDGTKRELVMERVHFRCPSLVEHDGVSVLSQIQDLLSRRKMAIGDTSKPMTYNLLTSFFNGVDEDHQHATAKKIFSAVHEHNASVKSGESYFFPLSIPVNQQTVPLSLSRSATAEATFLSHLAIANSTLSEVIHRHSEFLQALGFKEMETSIQAMNTLYQRFIHQDICPADFYIAFQQEINKISTLIANFSMIQNPSKNDKLQIALLQIFYSQYSRDPWMHKTPGEQSIYGSLVQALHLVTSSGNVVGCKSANDRFALVWDIVEALRNPSESIQATLNAFLKHPENLRAFATAVHQETNQHHLYGAGAMPACIDTGPSKHKLSTNLEDRLDVGGMKLPTGHRLGLKTVPSIYTNLKAEHAEATQVHRKNAILKTIKKLLETVVKTSSMSLSSTARVLSVPYVIPGRRIFIPSSTSDSAPQ